MLRETRLLLLAAAGITVSSRAGAQAEAADVSPAAGSASPTDDPADLGQAPLAPATIRVHAYTLDECLALADRNFPNLWAARARLALAHAQLEETKWVPWFQWSASSAFGVAPALM